LHFFSLFFSFSIYAEVDKLGVMLTPDDKAESRSVRSQRKECHA